MSEKPKFEFYEMVRVSSGKTELAEINGMLSAVLGRAKNDDGSWCYTIHVYDRPTTYSVPQSDLTSTGEHAQRSDFYSEDSIRVSRDGEIIG